MPLPYKQCLSGTNPATDIQQSCLGIGLKYSGRPCPGHLPKSQNELSARTVRAQGQKWPTHMHTHTHGSAGSRVPDAVPRPGAGGSPGVGSSRRGGCSRTELEHSLPCGRGPALTPPIPSPARGLCAPLTARVRARAQARALRGRPRRPKESVDP